MQARRARSLSVTFDGNAKCDPVMDGGYTYTLFRQPSFHTVRLALRNSERELGVGSSRRRHRRTSKKSRAQIIHKYRLLDVYQRETIQKGSTTASN